MTLVLGIRSHVSRTARRDSGGIPLGTIFAGTAPSGTGGSLTTSPSPTPTTHPFGRAGDEADSVVDGRRWSPLGASSRRGRLMARWGMVRDRSGIP